MFDKYYREISDVHFIKSACHFNLLTNNVFWCGLEKRGSQNPKQNHLCRHNNVKVNNLNNREFKPLMRDWKM